jgi:hypothetical protein
MTMTTASSVVSTGFRRPWRKETDNLRVKNGVIGCKTNDMKEQKEKTTMQQQGTQIQKISVTRSRLDQHHEQWSIDAGKGCYLGCQPRTGNVEEPEEKRGYTHIKCAPEESGNR